MVTNKTVGKDLMPTDGQWNTLEHIEECLRTMAKFQEMIMGDQYFSCGDIYCKIWAACKRLTNSQVTKRPIGVLAKMSSRISMSDINQEIMEMFIPLVRLRLALKNCHGSPHVLLYGFNLSTLSDRYVVENEDWRWLQPADKEFGCLYDWLTERPAKAKI